MNSTKTRNCLWCGTEFTVSGNGMKKYCRSGCASWFRSWVEITSRGRQWKKNIPFLYADGRQKQTVRLYANSASLTASEQTVYEQLLRDEWTVLRNGWPDFVAIRNDTCVLIEVKRPNERLRKEQQVLHAVLKKFFNIEVHVVTPHQILYEKQIQDRIGNIFNEVQVSKILSRKSSY